LAFNKVTDEAKKSIDYGQYNMGLVADGVMFDFPKGHPLIAQVRSLIEAYQEKSNKEESQ